MNANDHRMERETYPSNLAFFLVMDQFSTEQKKKKKSSTSANRGWYISPPSIHLLALKMIYYGKILSLRNYTIMLSSRCKLFPAGEIFQLICIIRRS